MVYKSLCICVLWAKVASALEGLKLRLGTITVLEFGEKMNMMGKESCLFRFAPLYNQTPIDVWSTGARIRCLHCIM